jgi:CRISPR-associated RAMP protein (TIGR02581 family)
MYSQLTNRYCLEGKLVLASGLHIGSGLPDPDIDMPVMRDAAGQPFIPGSSLRGVMRSLVERALATLAPGAGCTLFDESHPYCPTSNKQARKGIEKLIETGSSKAALDRLLAQAPQPGQLCDICRLFGSTFIASKLKVFDLRLRDETASASHASEKWVRHGVGIDRDKGTAREKIKFNYEVLERAAPDLEFGFEIVGENLGRVGTGKGPDFALLGLAWKLMGKHLTIGGKSGSGLGRAAPVLSKVQYFDEDEPSKDGRKNGLREFLLAEEPASGYGDMSPTTMTAFLKAELTEYLTVRRPRA